MKIKYLIFIYFIVFIISSCSERNNEMKSIIKEFHDRKIKFSENTKYLIILPEVGCGGCISEGTDFIKKNIERFNCNNDELRAAFTSIKSKKLLLRALEIDSFDNYCFEIDEDNKYRINNPKSIYPLILYLNKGKINHIEFQSPDNPNAFNTLESHINISPK